jgi:hypothetical protein
LNLDFKDEICPLMLYADDCFVDCHNSEALDYVKNEITKNKVDALANGDVVPLIRILFDFRQPR